MSKFLTWLLGPPAGKRNVPVLRAGEPEEVPRAEPMNLTGYAGWHDQKTGRIVPPPAAESLASHPVTVMHVNLDGPEFQRAVEHAVRRIQQHRGSRWPLA